MKKFKILIFLSIFTIFCFISIVYFYFLPIRGWSGLDIVVDKEGNLHFAQTESHWDIGSRREINELYYRKFSPEGELIIRPVKIGKNLKFLKQTIDSEDNLHIFAHFFLERFQYKKPIQDSTISYLKYFKIKNGKIILEKEIKGKNSLKPRIKGDTWIKPKEGSLKIGIDEEDNIYLSYLMEKLRLKEDEYHVGYAVEDIKIYFQKWNKDGEILIPPKEIKVNLRKKTLENFAGVSRNIVIYENEIYIPYKYLIVLNQEGNFVRLAGALPDLPIIPKNGHFLNFSDNGVVIGNDLYLFIGRPDNPPHLLHYKDYLLTCRKLNQKLEKIKEVDITKFSKSLLSPRPTILGIKATKDKNDNIFVGYYVNNGRNFFTTYYSKIDRECKVINERVRMR